MDLINLYIQEVTRRLPENMREDISLELRSTILDMLPDDFSNEDAEQVLDKLGNPAVLASRYKNRPMHLIGPKFYDMYVSILKMVLLIVTAVTFVSFIIQQMMMNVGNERSFILTAPMILGEAIWVLLGAIIQVFFWVTIIFIILDRIIGSTDNSPISLSGKKWTAKDLESISYTPLKRKITKGEILFSLFWTFLWVTIYFNATNIIGIYEKNSSGLDFTIPIFNQETLLSYLAIVVLIVALEIFRVGYMAFTRQWTKKLAFSNALIHFVSFIFLLFIASNPELFHPDFMPYLANLMNRPLETVNSLILSIMWLIVLSVIVTGIIDSYNGFRKARING